jgi:hypothetical protein
MDIVSEVTKLPLYDTGDLNIYNFLNALNYNKYKTKKVNKKYG